jgi:acetylornithine deacetylase/succinyl-diaminopimelate desuccinylase-like protein
MRRNDSTLIPARVPAYAEAQRNRFVSELMSFIRFPSVSAQPLHAGEVKACAVWLASRLGEVGLDHVQVISTPGHPLVYADWLHAPGRPTVLVYGHYDVQPPDPLNEWTSPPFEPTVRGDNIYGRGASDDKGQMFTHIKAIESYLQTVGSLPVNVKCIFEGEEEIGSKNLTAFLSDNKDSLAANVAVMSDMPMLAPDRPALTYAMRGALSLELEIRGQKIDLHSGNFGGAVYNPLQALGEIIASLHDRDGRVAIPGFYDNVQNLGRSERDYLSHTGPSDEEILRNAQATRAWGERGFSVYERTTIRPALTINGIVGGYPGPGVKAVLPSRAFAKFDFRLVPNQDPQEISQLFRLHIARHTPPALSTTVRTRFKARPARINHRHASMSAAAAAYEKGFGATPVLLRSGGTIPVVSVFEEMLSIPTVLMGFALPDDRLHAPNEKFHLPNFYNGIATSINFLAEIGARRIELGTQRANGRATTTAAKVNDGRQLTLEAGAFKAKGRKASQQGRWNRKGRRIVALLPGDDELDRAIAGEILNPNEVINPRIDVGGQKSLLRMMKGDQGSRAAATGMLEAIKSGQLAGIYGDDLLAAVKVAQKLGTVRWELVPGGEDAAVVVDPANPLTAPPTIIFRGDTPDIRLIPSRLDPALRKAWASFHLLKAGQLTRCDLSLPTGIQSELSLCIPLSNIMPALFGQIAGPSSCIQPVSDGILTSILGFPARDLTKEQARDIVALLVGGGKVMLKQPSLQFDKECKVLRPGPNEKIVIQPPIIDGVKIINDDPSIPKEKKDSFPVIGVDLRMVVLLFSLARFLRLKWGATEIHHSGIGSDGTHKGRLALDFSGVAGTVAGPLTKFGVSLAGPFNLTVLRDWGTKPVQLPNGKKAVRWPDNLNGLAFRDTTYRLDTAKNEFVGAGRESRLAFLIFGDIYDFVTRHCTDRGGETCKGKQPQGQPTTIGKESQCIIHPDHPNPSLRPTHVNHIHMEIPL